MKNILFNNIFTINDYIDGIMCLKILTVYINLTSITNINVTYNNNRRVKYDKVLK